MNKNSFVNKESMYQTITTLQIKNDCLTLIGLQRVLSQPILSLAFLPLYSLFVEEIENTIGQKGTLFKIQNESPFKISNVRSKLKLFGSDRLGKSRKITSKLDEVQGEIYRSKLRFDFTKNLNIHYNLGIFFNEEGRVLGNTQYFYYMFQEQETSDREYEIEEIKAFSQALGTVISSVDSGLKDVLPNDKVIIKEKNYSIRYKDFNTDRVQFCKFGNNPLRKEISLILLHVLSNINFVRFVLDEVLTRDNTYLFRVKYISFYYTCKSIQKILEFLKRKGMDDSIFIELEELVKGSQYLLDSEFRNCMMHYSFKNKEKYLIDDSRLDINILLYGLVETRFEGMGFYDLNDKVTTHINAFSDSIEKILDISTSGLKNL